jgi:hypothetical protein
MQGGFAKQAAVAAARGIACAGGLALRAEAALPTL